MGGVLFEKLEGKIPIIGVAKTKFHGNIANVIELLRGKSIKPLYITAERIELGQAKEMIQSMHGNFRIPTLLQLLDTKTKENSRGNCGVNAIGAI